MKLQRQLSNATWIDASDEFLARAAEKNGLDVASTVAALQAGQLLYFSMEWYSQIRDADAIRIRSAKQPVQKLCDCGHYSAHPMMTSQGSSCPDCYDRMS